MWKNIEETRQLESSEYISSWWPGRITIKVVLDSLPTYVMSVFPIPSRVEERLDKLEDNTIIYMVVNLEKDTIDILGYYQSCSDSQRQLFQYIILLV